SGKEAVWLVFEQRKPSFTSKAFRVRRRIVLPFDAKLFEHGFRGHHCIRVSIRIINRFARRSDLRQLARVASCEINLRLRTLFEHSLSHRDHEHEQGTDVFPLASVSELKRHPLRVAEPTLVGLLIEANCFTLLSEF